MTSSHFIFYYYEVCQRSHIPNIIPIFAQSGNMMCVFTHILYNKQCKHMITGIIEANPEEGKDSEETRKQDEERERERKIFLYE